MTQAEIFALKMLRNKFNSDYEKHRQSASADRGKISNSNLADNNSNTWYEIGYAEGSLTIISLWKQSLDALITSAEEDFKHDAR